MVWSQVSGDGAGYSACPPGLASDTVCLAASAAGWVLDCLDSRKAALHWESCRHLFTGSLHRPWHFLQVNGVRPVKVLRNLVGSLLAQHPLADSRTWLQDAHAQVATAVQAGKQSLKGNR